MKAIVQDRYGPPEVLSAADLDVPRPSDNEILVRVHAAAINAADWHIMRGDPYVARLVLPSVFGRKGPKGRIRGRDFAGRVAGVGASVRRFNLGDEVFGDAGDANGAFAEYVTVQADLAELKPVNISFEKAAAIPLSGSTALIGLRDLGKVQPNQQVLINGASGGVGTFAVQIAKAFGATVTAVCSARNIDLVRSIGADHAIDYSVNDFTRSDQKYDVIFDLVGNRTLTALRRALTPTGTLILSGGGTSGDGSIVGPMGLLIRATLTSRFVKHRLLQLKVTPSGENLVTLKHLAESGAITPVIDRTYPLAEVPAAIRYMETEHARAKIVITI